MRVLPETKQALMDAKHGLPLKYHWDEAIESYVLHIPKYSMFFKKKMAVPQSPAEPINEHIIPVEAIEPITTVDNTDNVEPITTAVLIV